MSELCDLSAVELRHLIGTGQLSPVELLESCIRRIEAVNPLLNAIVNFCPERARSEAVAAEQAAARGDDLGPLHGLPLGVKDLNHVAGIRTTFGSPLFADFVPGADEDVVARMRRAGAAEPAVRCNDELYTKQIDGEDMGGYLRWEAIAYGVTMMSNPALVVPCGLGPGGLPFGLQIVGPLGRDAWLLDVGHTLESLFSTIEGLGRPRPDLSLLERS